MQQRPSRTSTITVEALLAWRNNNRLTPLNNIRATAHTISMLYLATAELLKSRPTSSYRTWKVAPTESYWYGCDGAAILQLLFLGLFPLPGHYVQHTLVVLVVLVVQE